jgi:hypothetical protein
MQKGTSSTMLTQKEFPGAGLQYIRKERDVQYHQTLYDLLAAIGGGPERRGQGLSRGAGAGSTAGAEGEVMAEAIPVHPAGTDTRNYVWHPR